MYLTTKVPGPPGESGAVHVDVFMPASPASCRQEQQPAVSCGWVRGFAEPQLRSLREQDLPPNEVGSLEAERALSYGVKLPLSSLHGAQRTRNY